MPFKIIDGFFLFNFSEWDSYWPEDDFLEQFDALSGSRSESNLVGFATFVLYLLLIMTDFRSNGAIS